MLWLEIEKSHFLSHGYFILRTLKSKFLRKLPSCLKVGKFKRKNSNLKSANSEILKHTKRNAENPIRELMIEKW